MALERLRRRADFLKVAETRHRLAAPGMVVQVRRRTEAETAGRAGIGAETVRIGFTASRKVGGAVERNRARRRLKAAAAQVLPVRAEPGHDYVLIARSETLTRPYALLLADLERALARLGSARQGGSRHGGARQGGPRKDGA